MGRLWYGMILVILVSAGCMRPPQSVNTLAEASLPLTEPVWVHNGEPIEMEGGVWFPTREVERFMDSEMFLIGKIRDTNVYVERTDVKPYARLYTRFDQGRYRAFEPKNQTGE